MADEKEKMKKKKRPLIQLDDLLPQDDVTGGTGKPAVIFGSTVADSNNKTGRK